MKLDQLTFTRFIAAITILIFHLGLGIPPFNHKSISFIFENANIAMSYFFVLSGFIMIIAYGNKKTINIKEYLRNRFARIYPILAFSVFLYIILCLTVFNNFETINKTDILLNLFVIQAWIPGKALIFNYPTWTLSVEIFFYLLFPLLYNRVYTKVSLNKLAVPIITFWIISYIVLEVLFRTDENQSGSLKMHDFIFFFPLMHLNAFLMGNLGGLFFMHKLKNKTGKFDIPIIIMVIILLSVIKYADGVIFHNGILAILYIPIILLLSINRGFITSLFNTKLFAFLGEISYGIYILHIPVFPFAKIKLQSYFGYDNNETFMFYASMLCVMISATITYYCIEKPCRNLIKKIKVNKGAKIIVKSI